IQPLLCVLRPVRLSRPLPGRLADRQDRPPPHLHRDPDRGRDLHDALGLFRGPRAAMGVRPALVSRLPRLLGTEHDPDGGDLPDPDPRRRQRRGLGDRLSGRLRAVSLRLDRAAAAHRFVRAGVPLHPRADARDGDRCVPVRAGAYRQGAERNQRVIRY
ncbi:hypothetical protein chiPu_0033475, partial [Chiloscyllium punctatum]|nr:hypothetical protein [Chiloscyllium punctatum]